MGQVRELISFTIAAVMMVTSMIGQPVACADIDTSNEVTASVSVQSAGTELATLNEDNHSEGSNHSNSAAHHCHCVNQVCCGFLVIPVISSVGTDSKAKDSPLVSAVLYSWISAPPARPPSV